MVPLLKFRTGHAPFVLLYPFSVFEDLHAKRFFHPVRIVT